MQSHTVLQDDLDSTQIEIIELRANETTLETKITLLREKVSEMKNHSASTLGRSIEQERRKSSGVHPRMETLLEEEENGADGEDTSHLITGSQLVIDGGIPGKAGDRRFTCFGNSNPYFDLVELSMLQSDAEEESEKDAKETHRHNGLSMDTNVPKMLK